MNYIRHSQCVRYYHYFNHQSLSLNSHHSVMAGTTSHWSDVGTTSTFGETDKLVNARAQPHSSGRYGFEDADSKIVQPYYFTIALTIYLAVIGFLSVGQQHMDYGVNISAWAVIVTIAQVLMTFMTAYYWKKLFYVNRVWKSHILALTTITSVLLFKLSWDIYFILAYAPLYDTQNGSNTYAQRLFDSFFNTVNIALIVDFPCALAFSVIYYKHSYDSLAAKDYHR